MDKKISRAELKEAELANRKTPWVSIAIVGILLFFSGLQFSVYFSSLWQYLSMIDPTVSVDFLGIAMSASALGAAMSSPLLGFWSQRTGLTRPPLMFALIISTLGNGLYALLPSFDENRRYLMLLARLLMGFFAGSLGILNSYLATASTKQDRIKVVAAGNLAMTLGLTIGPGVQMIFLFVEPKWIGPFYIHVYNAPAYFMTTITLIGVFIVYFAVKEDYVGIISEEEKSEDEYLVIPKFDRVAVCVLFLMWWFISGLFSMEALYAPILVAMYNWSHKEALLYIGLILSSSCIVSLMYTSILAKTRLADIDRRVQLLIGLFLFLIYTLSQQPWFFYGGPLDPPKEGYNVSEVGGCEFEWCKTTTRVPKILFLFNAIFTLGISYPCAMCNVSTLLSLILGPRKQGFINGLYTTIGFSAELFVPIFSTMIFYSSGYRWIMRYHLIMNLICIFLVFFFRKRLQPLSLLPPVGKATKYKRGIFYRF